MFKDNLERMMAERNLSAYQMEQEIGISRQSITNWKKGTIPSIESVIKVAKYFGVSADKMLK